MVILFLHGWGGNAASFAPIADYFRGQHQVICPTLPCPPRDQVYTLDDYANDVMAELTAHGVRQCVVVAHSFGARLVAVLNARFPQLLTRIISTGGAGLRPRWSIKRWLVKLWRRHHGGSPDYQNLTVTGKRTFQNVVNRDLSPEIAQIRVPTLIIHGRHDDAVPLSMAKRWQKLIPGAQLKIYRGGHFAYLTEPARFINDVARWLS